MFLEWRNKTWLLLKAIWKRSQLDRDLNDEVAFHLAMREEKNRRAGIAPDEAHYAARRLFGNTTSLKERSWEMWTLVSLEGLLQDIRFGARKLRKSPGFTFVAVLTLALGIGANTAIFSLIHTVMLKSLPVTKPGELYRVGQGNECCAVDGFQGNFGIFSYSLYKQIRDNTPEFSQIAAFSAGLDFLNARRSGAAAVAEPYVGEYVSGNYFETLGLSAYAGRLLSQSDDQPNAPPAAVMSYRTWREHFSLNPNVIGGDFLINGSHLTIVGITPPEFFGETLRHDPPDFWVPLANEPLLRQGGLLAHSDIHWLYLIGRLRSEASPRNVQARITVEVQQWLTTYGQVPQQFRGEIPKQNVALTAAGGGVARMRTRYSEGLRLLAAASGLVLLIACANVANLLLAQGAAQRAQTVMRVALGAPRSRLVRLALTEGVILGLLGGAVGLAVAYAGTRVILSLAFRGAHYVPIDAMPSLPVLGFAALLSLLTSVIFAAAPAWINSKASAGEALHGAQRSVHSGSSIPQKSLVVLQAALSLVLLAGAGLLAESLRNLEGQQFGFATDGRLIVKIDPTLAGYTSDHLAGLYRSLKDRLRQIPGVESVSFSLYSPMADMNWSGGISIAGRAHSSNPHDWDGSSWLRVSSDYFETIGTPLVRGRFIDERDTPNSLHVAVINEAFARKYFPNSDSLGKHFGAGDAGHSGDYEIVGIVGDAKYEDARDNAWPTYFRPLLQMEKFKEESDQSAELRSNWIHDIELHVQERSQNLQPLIREALAGIDPNLPVLDMVTFTEQVSRNFNQERLIARLASLFGLFALTLACIGLYGVLAYNVARRTREIGIRMALGAARSGILRMVLGEALFLAALGVAIGVPCALAANHLLTSMLFGLKATNPVVLSVVTALLLLVAMAAACFPAHKASAVDPMVTLRHE
ncbi:MAG TPA: ABC transporter permease [Candidatus Binatus sp.]|jgi:predicted permease|nr:ABC transporter permease [Candidatus Binatus sp.]